MISKNITLKFESGKVKFLKDVDFVLEKYNIDPSLLGEVMQLTGDSGDDVDGVEKVGIKTAVKLIKANGSVRNILRDVQSTKTYNNKKELKPLSQKLIDNIEAAREQILLNKELVVLNTTIPVPDIQTTMNPNWLKFYMFLNHYNIQSFMNIKSFNLCRQVICYSNT